MKVSSLSSKEKEILDLINKNRQKPINWEKMPKQEVLTHIYGFDNPNIDIDKLLTPKEKKILNDLGYIVTNALKQNVDVLKRVRLLRKNPNLPFRI
jgi:hypothetical protein